MTASPPVASSTLTPLPVLDCSQLFSGAALDESAAARLAALLRVVADPARLRILSLLQAQPSHEACVCHVTDFLAIGQPTVSHPCACCSTPGSCNASAVATGSITGRSQPRSRTYELRSGLAIHPEKAPRQPAVAGGDDCECQ